MHQTAVTLRDYGLWPVGTTTNSCRHPLESHWRPQAAKSIGGRAEGGQESLTIENSKQCQCVFGAQIGGRGVVYCAGRRGE